MFIRRPDYYLWIRRSLVILTSAALLGHLAFPLAPPRMLPQLGFVDTGILYDMSVYGAHGANSLANQYAAMPSLHVAWAALVAVGLIVSTNVWWRWFWLIHPVITLAVVVVTANHYWLDGIIGIILLAIALAVTVRSRPSLLTAERAKTAETDAEKPDADAAQPEAAGEPEAATAEPEPVTAEPEPVTAEPEPVTAEPEPVTAEPETVTAELEAATAQPEPATLEPEPVAADLVPAVTATADPVPAATAKAATATSAITAAAAADSDRLVTAAPATVHEAPAALADTPAKPLDTPELQR
jgi:outer membrane biosynthesis protein TonB